jgi:outer membrane protein TolC
MSLHAQSVFHLLMTNARQNIWRRSSFFTRTWPKRSIAAGLFSFLIATTRGFAQSAPVSSEKPWHSVQEDKFSRALKALPEPTYSLTPDKIYTFGDLVDLGEQHNPETRIAWQNAKTEAARLGIAKSALYPVLAAVALASTTRYGQLLGASFHRQTIGLFQPTLNLDYLIFDFGGRSGAIDAARANLFAADFAFNDTHRKIIYQVTSAYYRLLNAIGLQDAAKASLLNAQTVQQDAEERLSHGLATAPDVLEAKAGRAQAEYDLQAAIGAQEIAQGDLATTLGLPPSRALPVQGIDELATPSALAESADQAIARAFQQRPDLLEQVARLRATDAAVKQARSAYFPTLTFSGDAGLQRAYGQQDLLPGTYGQIWAWNAQLNLKWTLFDGGRREHEIAEAKAQRTQTQAGVDALRDQISDEVWTAYSNAKTALRQQQAAIALVEASEQSYTSALQAYNYGVRNLLDVVAAQRALAQARTANVSARTQVLTQITNLAFRTGDLLHTQSVNPRP